MKRLKIPTGKISDEVESGKDSVVRHALLVHTGPNGEEITFMSGDGEISFDDERIKSIEKNHNAMIKSLAEGYGGIDKMPIGAFPPILNQHDDDSTDRIIGRLASLLSYEKLDVPGVGKNCSCLTADITFLGSGTVERVADGRLFHLSIGIDEETNTLGETSVVITPAASGARLLNKGKKQMNKKLEAHKKKMKTLKAMKETLSGMTKKVTAANEQVKLAAKQGMVSHRLTSLVRGGKITPAEFKKMDLKKLSQLPKEQLDIMIGAFEAMESKVLAGQRGTTSALTFSDIGKNLEKKQMMKLKAEVKGDFKKMGKKLSSDPEEKEHEEKIQDKSHEMGEASHGEHMKKHLECMEEMKKHMESGDMKSALACHTAAMKHLEEMGHVEEDKKELELGDVKSEDYQKSSDELQQQVDELNTQVARIAGMVEELMETEKHEGEEMTEDGKEHEKLSGGFAGPETKEVEKKPEHEVDDKKHLEDEELKKKHLEEMDGLKKKHLEEMEEMKGKKLSEEEKKNDKKLKKEMDEDLKKSKKGSK